MTAGQLDLLEMLRTPGGGLGFSWPTVVPGFGVCACGCSLLHHGPGGPAVTDPLGPCRRCTTCTRSAA